MTVPGSWGPPHTRPGGAAEAWDPAGRKSHALVCGPAGVWHPSPGPLTCHPEMEGVGGLLPLRAPQPHGVQAAVREAGHRDQELGEAVLGGGHTPLRQGQAVLQPGHLRHGCSLGDKGDVRGALRKHEGCAWWGRGGGRDKGQGETAGGTGGNGGRRGWMPLGEDPRTSGLYSVRFWAGNDQTWTHAAGA